MLTRRYLTTALYAEETILVVAGGVGEGNRLLTTVEVMRTENRQWSTATSLPLPLTRYSITLLGGHVYLLGGLTVNESSRRVLSCSLRRLMESASSRLRGMESELVMFGIIHSQISQFMTPPVCHSVALCW